ncbi:ABC transporter substrate-binding protein [Roseibacillus persicicus]|uniref:ABC transporter substrate-binding protein n=1 Tax=Roseibacillus persicicus TaxID=454148 RepID=UPI00280ED68F|nr:ABC transporter substrate-binding protein [Roseibacillus persicicus]MDQ8189877.1 ABC transporter substrate-binding protein [Roseibacillus persicicus]
MSLLRTVSFSFLGLVLLLQLCGCKDNDEVGKMGLNSEAFYARYNRYIADWLEGEKQRASEEIAKIEKSLAEAADEEEQKRLESSLAEFQRQVDRAEFRQGLGDFFAFKDPVELPENLVWEDGMDAPDIGDPAAKKGGVFNYFWTTFPPTVRQIGSNSNNGARGDLYDLIEVYLVHFHPVTQQIIPGIAKEWALSEDGRTVYFRLHPEAKFNDGHPIEAEDFLTWARLRLADQVDSIYFKQAIREQFAQFSVYGPHLLGITLPEAKSKDFMPYECGSIGPGATHFFKDFGPDFEERYQWVVPPTSAPYRMDPEDLVKGESLTLTRVDDWWLRDRKFYRNRFNADKIVYRVINNPTKAWELFRAGELDYFGITLPEYYYDRSEMPAVFDGFVERSTWYNQYPRLPWGLYFNTAEPPLDNKMIRRGLAYATNWDKVIDVVFRGDFSRLDGFTSGYGKITNPDVKARPFSINKAREAFAAAGYTREDKDGILMNEQGKRLEVSLTFTSSPERAKIMVVLKEEARKAGVNYILDGLEATSAYKKVVSKEHQGYFSAWQFTPPAPAYYEYFHSRNAYDEKGNRKAQTNNVFSYADDRMDVLTDNYRNARTMEELIENAHEIQAIVAEEDLFIPGYTNEFSRVATWRWVRWPDTEETRFAPPLSYIPMESYVYWIDEDIKEETLEAKRKGTTFPEVERVVEAYRTQPKLEEPALSEPRQEINLEEGIEE